jgi:hypothetical protein
MVCNLRNGGSYNNSGQNYKRSALPAESFLQRGEECAARTFSQVLPWLGLAAEAQPRWRRFGITVAFVFTRQRGCDSDR